MEIRIPRSVAIRIRRSLRRAGDREIGGVLMGEQICPGEFRIVDFSVDDQSGSRAHFVRDPSRHSSALDDFFERTGADYARFNYLGEWHSHPNFSVRPSPADALSMQSLVDGERGIDFSVLLIVRLRWLLRVEATASVFLKGREPYQANIAREQ